MPLPSKVLPVSSGSWQPAPAGVGPGYPGSFLGYVIGLYPIWPLNVVALLPAPRGSCSQQELVGIGPHGRSAAAAVLLCSVADCCALQQIWRGSPINVFDGNDAWTPLQYERWIAPPVYFAQLFCIRSTAVDENTCASCTDCAATSEQCAAYRHSARLQATLYAHGPTWKTFFVMTVFGQLPWKDPMRMAPPKPWLWLSTKVLLVKKERSVPARASLSQKSWKIAPPNAPFTVTLLPLKVDCTVQGFLVRSEMGAVCAPGQIAVAVALAAAHCTNSTHTQARCCLPCSIQYQQESVCFICTPW